MRDFAYATPSTVEEAVVLLSDKWGEAEIMAGGTDLVTCLKQDLTKPDRVVSLKGIAGLSGISTEGESIKIGATTKLRELIANADVQKNFPALVTAATNIASPQMINMGTVGGDLLQRPRCWYFRMGFGLFGTQDGKPLVPTGENRYHAIFGNSGPAYFVNPSSLAPALIALDATFHVAGAKARDIKAAEFFATPKTETDREYALKSNEILTAISVPVKGLKNGVYEIRQRTGLDWPMVAAAVAFDGSGGKVVLGHVAPTPWVAQKASGMLKGAPSEAEAASIGAAAADGATPMSKNSYKIQQVKVAVKRAIVAAA
jgi:xanthine dehydrogenase YagS FAD-binding subunit